MNVAVDIDIDTDTDIDIDDIDIDDIDTARHATALTRRRHTTQQYRAERIDARVEHHYNIGAKYLIDSLYALFRIVWTPRPRRDRHDNTFLNI